MASEIKRSPTLRGADAERFLKEVSNPKPIAKNGDLERKKLEVRDVWREFRERK